MTVALLPPFAPSHHDGLEESFLLQCIVLSTVLTAQVLWGTG